ELHGDRLFREDAAIIGGWARLDGETVMVIGHQRGRDTKENLRRNFGMPHPEGYRKALRLMKLAEKFHVPVLTFIDTPGAWAGLGAEERGQSEAIARNLFEMSRLEVPILATVIGEGGSAGTWMSSVVSSPTSSLGGGARSSSGSASSWSRELLPCLTRPLHRTLRQDVASHRSRVQGQS